MKKILATGIVAICLIALSQQQASAWVNSRFSIGLNWSCQSGGNNFGWGLWRNGQPPGPEAYGQSFGGSSSGYLPYPVMPSYDHHHHSAVETPAPAYATPSVTYPSPYQFATYPRPIYYYYPTPYYYGQ